MQVSNKSHLHKSRRKNVVLQLVVLGLGHNTKIHERDVEMKFLRIVNGYTAVERILEKYETNNYSDPGILGGDITEFCSWIPTFRRNISESSGAKN
jgi:hypothetical protein